MSENKESYHYKGYCIDYIGYGTYKIAGLTMQFGSVRSAKNHIDQIEEIQASQDNSYYEETAYLQ